MPEWSQTNSSHPSVERRVPKPREKRWPQKATSPDNGIQDKNAGWGLSARSSQKAFLAERESCWEEKCRDRDSHSCWESWESAGGIWVGTHKKDRTSVSAQFPFTLCTTSTYQKTEPRDDYVALLLRPKYQKKPFPEWLAGKLSEERGEWRAQMKTGKKSRLPKLFHLAMPTLKCWSNMQVENVLQEEMTPNLHKLFQN